MRAHRSLKQEDVVRYGPAKIAAMVASEFWRASSGSEYTADVKSCYTRARELMGILETLPMEDAVASDLQTTYKECVWQELVKEECLSSAHVQALSTRLAEKFDLAALQLSKETPHA